MRTEYKKTCSFFGHRTINNNDNLFERLLNQIEQLILTGFNEFLFGGYGDFDSLSQRAVNSLKGKYPHIKMIYIQAYYKPKDRNIEHIRKQYDEIVYPEIEEKPKRFAIIYRNREMINDSDFCIFYVSQSYGGALQALEYAKRKKKAFINLAE